MYSNRRTQLLAKVNFPLYTVQALSERHFLIAGGGGSSRSGIHNVIEIYELFSSGSTCRAECVKHFDTGDQVIMNTAVYSTGKYYLLFAGMEGDCRVYKITYEVPSTETLANSVKDTNASVRRRNTTKEKEGTSVENLPSNSSDIPDERLPSNSSGTLIFKIHPLETFQTDFSDEPFQKLVRFSESEMFLVTGGCDGHIRFWKPPKMKKILDIEAHENDVDDLDISPGGELIVTVSRDGYGRIWNSDDGNLIAELPNDLSTREEKYIFRSCRFGLVGDNEFDLFCTLNPEVRKKPPLKSYLCKFYTEDFQCEKTVSTGLDMLSTMAISKNGHFIALGTQGGSIKMYIAFSLQLVYNVENIHRIFVTSLSFLPISEESRRITGKNDASLLSVSVDNQIIIHHIPERKSMSVLTLITLCILTLFLVFLILDYLNL